MIPSVVVTWGAVLIAAVLDLGLVFWARAAGHRPVILAAAEEKPVERVSPSTWIQPLLALLSLALALRGEWILTHSNDSASSVVWFVAAAGALTALIWGRNRPEAAGLLLPATNVSRYLMASVLLGAGALSIIATREQAGLHFYWDAVMLWVGSWTAYLLAFRWPGWTWLWERVRAHRRELLLVAGLTVLAAALRFIWLDRIPDIMNGDEGLHGLYARGVVEGKNTHPFATFWGAGALSLDVVSLALRVLGDTKVATRVEPAIAGLLGVPAVYLLTRRLFGARPAFVAAGLTAVLHSHIQFSRVLGVGYIHATLFGSLGVYLLYSALETHSRVRAALGGVVLGLWLYVYVDSRFVPAVLAAWFVVMLAIPRYRGFILGNGRALAAFAGGYAAAAAPMGLWAARHPGDFGARFSSDGTLWNGYYAKLLAQNPSLNLPKFMADQAGHAFLSITRYPMWDFYQAPAPLLDVLSASLFWLAIVYSLLHLLDRRHLLLNIWLWSGVLAVGLLTIPRTSDGYRLLTVFIPIVILLGVMVEQLAEWLTADASDRAWPAWGICAAFLAAAFILNVNIYFRQYATSCKYGGDRATRSAYYLGTELAAMQPGERAVFLGNEFLRYGTHGSAQYLNPGVDVQNLTAPLPNDMLTVPAVQEYILIPERKGDLTALQGAFPGGTVEEIRDCGNPILYVYAMR